MGISLQWDWLLRKTRVGKLLSLLGDLHDALYDGHRPDDLTRQEADDILFDGFRMVRASTKNIFWRLYINSLIKIGEPGVDTFGKMPWHWHTHIHSRALPENLQRLYDQVRIWRSK